MVPHMPIKVRETISTAFHVFALFLTALIMLPLGAIAYWATDRRPPIENVSVRFLEWDEHDPNIALLTWTADRNQICQGKEFRWIYADRRRNLPPVELPPPGTVEPIGANGIMWTEEVPIPPEATKISHDHIALNIRMVWQCNPMHQYFPVVLDILEIEIPLRTRIR